MSGPARWLKVDLFRKEHGRLVLTDQGRTYMESATQPFLILEIANASIRSPRNENTMRIKCSPLFAKRWLISRVAMFVRDNPAIDIHLTADGTNGSTEDIDYDIQILDHPPESELPNVEPFMSDCILPVCHPRENDDGSSPRALPLIDDLLRLLELPAFYPAFCNRRAPAFFFYLASKFTHP
jgi:LysR family glycine cleavage system transcriptional activator